MYIYRIQNIKPSTCTLLEAAAIDMPTHLKIKSKRPLSKKAVMIKANKYLMEHYGEGIDFEDFDQINEADTNPIKIYGDVDTDSIIGDSDKDRKKHGLTGAAPTSFGSLADEIKKYVDDGRFQITDADTYEEVAQILRDYAADKNLNKAKAALEELFSRGMIMTDDDFDTDDDFSTLNNFDSDNPINTGKGTSVNSFGVNEDDDF